MARGVPDLNALISGLLRDLASVQADKPKQWGYKGAAAVIQELDAQVTDLIDREGRLQAIPFVGPASLRVINEVMATGRSELVERAVQSSGRTADVERRRALRGGVLSRAEVVRVLRLPLRGVVRTADYRGDLQMHSTWSDGAEPIRALAGACAARGYEFMAVTDHSKGLPIAGGLSDAELQAQHREIDALNGEDALSCRILKGLEANILLDGSLDVSRADCHGVEIVLAAPHAKLRTPADQTERLVNAVRTPWVHVLAHPRGRMAGSRPGVTADWDAVFETAARSHVAVELDGDPARQDLDHALAARALAAGCTFALDSDAHSSRQLGYADTALAHARLAGIPADRIINCWPLERLLDWLER
ncbi:MAG: PHP domain-containing protein [Acidobacteria bacterium]|nr:PHP domain-containing protein [Acidobacteriota bacterium]